MMIKPGVHHVKGKYEPMGNNKVIVSGYAESDFAFDYEYNNEKFYRIVISIERNSGTKDYLPVIVSERLFDVSKNIKRKCVFAYGEFRSFNQHSEDNFHLLLYVFASVFHVESMKQTANEISLDGFICKKPTYRKTPFGRIISDVILAVNRPCDESDYIPCVLWGRNAMIVSSLNVGDHVSISGRIQSREYIKKYDDHSEAHIAYEVSVSKIHYDE